MRLNKVARGLAAREITEQVSSGPTDYLFPSDPIESHLGAHVVVQGPVWVMGHDFLSRALTLAHGFERPVPVQQLEHGHQFLELEHGAAFVGLQHEAERSDACVRIVGFVRIALLVKTKQFPLFFITPKLNLEHHNNSARIVANLIQVNQQNLSTSLQLKLTTINMQLRINYRPIEDSSFVNGSWFQLFKSRSFSHNVGGLQSLISILRNFPPSLVESY